MPFEVLVKSCSDFYSPEKVQEAKDLLWKTVMTTHFGNRKDLRNIRRKNTGGSSKARVGCEDIVKAIQVCDKEGTEMPKFYAIAPCRKQTKERSEYLKIDPPISI